MSSTASQVSTSKWLMEHGPQELEMLFRTIVFQPATPILLADNDRHYREASVGASALLGLPRQDLIGRSLDDFAEPAMKAVIPELWQDFLEEGEQEGTLRLLDQDGTPHEVDYTAKGNVLPVRHLLVLRDKTAKARPGGQTVDDPIPAWVQDFALYLLNTDGQIAAWYEGAERIYGYKGREVKGKHVSFFCPDDQALPEVENKLRRAAADGHTGTENWQVRKDGSRFWANMITVALKDEHGDLQGFGRVVRDFSERHERDEKLRRNRLRTRTLPVQSTIVGIVSGEFDHVPEANDAFLEMVGYDREDLQSGSLRWPDLTPPEYWAMDEVAHEEGLQFGACTPYEKELTRKDGGRVPVLVAMAVLKLSPFRWITFITDLRDRDRAESVEDEAVEIKHNFEEIVGSSTVMKRVMAQVEVVAPTDATVLVLGETGPGRN